MDSQLSAGPDISTQSNVAWYPRFSGNDGLGTIGMEFQENFSGVEVPFGAEPLSYVATLASGNEGYAHNGATVQPHQNELSSEEEERRKLRRDRNKVAASKCRKKRKEHLNNLAQMSDELEGENVNLQSQIGELQAEIKKLENMLDSHQCSKTGTNQDCE